MLDVSSLQAKTKSLGQSVCADTAKAWSFRCGELKMISAPVENLFAANGEFHHVVTVNAEIFVLAHENQRLKCLLENTMNTVDGRILQVICRLMYPANGIHLLRGSDFIYDLAAWCQENRERLFLLGSSAESNARAVAVLKKFHPRLEVDGFGPPLAESPFGEPCRQKILDRIARWRPRHLVVCFGPPKQEFWISENAAELAAVGVRRAYGLGGTIDFVSGFRRRAPRWLQTIGAEWLFRLLCEPRARFRRTLIQFKMPFYAAKTDRMIVPLTDFSPNTDPPLQ
jgi:N-acetylglucosaminyldiphosphoundecaprenol N-acetyl-beta-D-mannosaminyltransferase